MPTNGWRPPLPQVSKPASPAPHRHREKGSSPSNDTDLHTNRSAASTEGILSDRGYEVPQTPRQRAKAPPRAALCNRPTEELHRTSHMTHGTIAHPSPQV